MALPINIEDLQEKPDRSISMEDINEAKSLRSRRYKNRRLGDFLKELNLTEGRATGIPTIQKKLRENGSPRPLTAMTAAAENILSPVLPKRFLRSTPMRPLKM